MGRTGSYDLFGHKHSSEIFKENDVFCFYKGDMKYMRCKDIAAKKLTKPEDISRAHGWFRKDIPASDLIQMSKNTPVEKRGFYVADKHLPAFVDFLNDDMKMEAVIQTGIAFAMQQASKTTVKKVAAPKLALEPVSIEEFSGEWMTFADLSNRTNISVTTLMWHSRDKNFTRRKRDDGVFEVYLTHDQITKLKHKSRPGCGVRKVKPTPETVTFLDRLLELWRLLIAKCNPRLLAYTSK
jgi:hypothetical protein